LYGRYGSYGVGLGLLAAVALVAVVFTVRVVARSGGAATAPVVHAHV